MNIIKTVNVNVVTRDLISKQKESSAMSNPVTGADEPGHVQNTVLPAHQPPSYTSSSVPQHKYHDPIAYFSSLVLERGDALVYAIVGISFFLGAVFALGYSFWDFGNALVNTWHWGSPTLQKDIADSIIKLISDLLLVLIIMEVLSTVIHYLKSHATSLRPFLFIGIISATRGILSIGARLSVESVQGGEFNNAMIELGVNALAILALGITLKLLGRTADDR